MRTPSSLGGKLILIMTAVGLVATIGITLLLAGIITPSFTTLQDRAVAAHVERTRAALSDYAADVESAARDYGDWTDGYSLPVRPDAVFEPEGFSALGMRDLGVEGMAHVTAEGRVVIARWRGPGTSADRRGMDTQFAKVIGQIDIAQVLRGRRSDRFYARVGSSVAAIGVALVRRSDRDRGARGYVVLARVVTAQQMSDRLKRDARIDLTTNGDTYSVTSSRSKLLIAVPVIGANGHAVATTRLSILRDVSLLGRRMLLLAVAGSTILLLLVLVVLRRMIARLVLRPLHRIEDHMQRVRVSGALTLLEEDERRDEIGSLGRSFNAMLRQLKDLREQIEVQSFDLGRSESAVAVMHNVRNALSPISTILSQEIAQTPPIDRTPINRAIAELACGDLPEARRRKLAAFVGAAIEAETTNRETTRRELATGRKAMAHVLEIIDQQQRAAHERPALEVCDVSDIIARNATIARYSQGASIAFSFPAGPYLVMASRVILSQVIGNLFGNAVEAIDARGTGSGSITALVAQSAERVTIQIRDDGEGFSPDIAPALFQRGFSTRAHKSGGLGLHWCANSVTAMQGALRLESDGPGLGAVAILTLRAGDQAMANGVVTNIGHKRLG